MRDHVLVADRDSVRLEALANALTHPAYRVISTSGLTALDSSSRPHLFAAVLDAGVLAKGHADGLSRDLLRTCHVIVLCDAGASISRMHLDHFHVQEVFARPIDEAALRERLIGLASEPGQPEMTSRPIRFIDEAFARTSSGMAFLDPFGNVLASNSAFDATAILAGYLVPQRRLAASSRLMGLLQQVCASSSNVESEISLFDDTGAERLIEVKVAPVADEEALSGVVMTLVDITRVRQAEAAEREQRILAEALRETASALARTLDPQNVLAQLIEHVGQVVPHLSANVMLLNDGMLRTTFLKGYSEPFASQLLVTQLPLKSFSTFTLAVENNETVVVNDVQAYPSWHPVPGSEHIRSLMTTPIRAYGRIIGLITLDSDRPNAFTEAHQARLRAFADQAAVALENAQLYEAIYRDAAKLRTLNRATSSLMTTDFSRENSLTEIYERIAQIVVQEFDNVDCAVIIHDPSDAEFDLHPVARAGTFKLDQHGNVSSRERSMISQAFLTGESLVAPDVSLNPYYRMGDERTRSEIVIPLKGTTGVLGVIDMQSPVLNAFTQEDVRILERFVERAVVIIEQIRLLESVQQRVTERTLELNRVKERAEAILNHSSDSILLLRPDGRIQQTNNAFNRAFGYEPDAVFNQSFESLAGPYYAEVLRRALEQVIESGTPQRLEIVADRRDGTFFDADAVMSPVLQKDQIVGVVCSLRDISAHKQLERDLLEALERERELHDFKAQFVARASHEFRTPLMMISAATDLLRAYGNQYDADKRNEKLDAVQAQIERITQMLDEMLTISHAQELGTDILQWTLVEPESLIREIIREMEEGIGADHHFEFKAGDIPVQISADARWLRRAVVNLLSNAIKYSDAGSTVRISLTSTPSSLIIRIQDEGLGITEYDLKHLFEPFHRGQNVEHIAGTGLGLAIVRQAAELHGGSVAVQSRVGVGSAFTFEIPITSITERLIS